MTTQKLRADLDLVRRIVSSRRQDPVNIRRPGFVSIACAEYLASAFVIGNARSGRLDILPGHVRDPLLGRSREILGLETKAALTTTDIPLPTQFFSEIRELISDFGVARNKMFPFPIGLGTAKPPRFKTRPSFGSVAMSAAMPEKSPQVEFAALESHKVGGIVRVPREIDEQSIVPMGQFLARYGAVEFARAEDTWGFMADGTATYDSVKGIVKIARDNSKTVVLAPTKTKPSDALLADFRLVRTKVNKAALSARRSAYYLDSTWEVQLPTFNSAAEPHVYQRMQDGSAILDGYPVVWTDVLEPYGTAAAADKPIAVFGALDFWWFGEHGQPRMDFSQDVYFTTDELATRFIEEIDFDYQQVDVTAALLTAAS
jgi:HK97 family phage major capsid protein